MKTLKQDRRDYNPPQRRLPLVPHVNTPNIGPNAGKIVTDSYVLQAADKFIICDKATAMTITIPAAEGLFIPLNISNINIGLVTIIVATTSPAHTIDGETSQQLRQWENITLIDYAAGKYKIL